MSDNIRVERRTMVDHQELIRLTIAYTLAGAFVFTVVITCLSLVGWIRFADKKQQQKLFTCNRNFQSARGQLQDCGDKSRVFRNEASERIYRDVTEKTAGLTTI